LLLEQEGFSCRGYVDIFDGGPTMEANLQHIRSAQVSRKLAIKIDDSAAASGELHFIINTKVSDFRGVCSELIEDHDKQQAIVTAETASALNLVEGDLIRFASTRARC
jgi:arginine N-succinyltransferase